MIATPLRLVLGLFSGSYYLSLIDIGMLGHNLECTLYTKEERTQHVDLFVLCRYKVGLLEGDLAPRFRIYTKTYGDRANIIFRIWPQDFGTAYHMTYVTLALLKTLRND